MKKKIVMILIGVIFILVVSKLFNFVILNRVHTAIEGFKKTPNRYYHIYGNVSDYEYDEKIYFRDKILKYVFTKQNEKLLYELKDFKTNEHYYVNLKGKTISYDKLTINDSETLVRLPRMISNTFYNSTKNSFLECLKVKYIIPTQYKNKKCFKIVTSSETIIIDANTYLPLYLCTKVTNSEKEIILFETFYEFQTNTVTDEDIAFPDLTGFQIIQE